MFSRTLFLAAVALGATIGLAGCAGPGVSAPSPAGGGTQADTVHASNAQPPAQSVDVRVGPIPATATVPLAPQLTGSITLHSTSSSATLQIGTTPVGTTPATTSGRATTLWLKSCPPVPPIVIFNPDSHPVTIAIDRFSVQLPCSVNGLLFGASSYQSYPVLPTLVSTKLGDAKGTGQTITFIPTVSQLTFPAKSALTILVSPETSPAFVQLPAIANATSVLTSNAPTVPNSLALEPPNAQGGTTFQSACYLPNAGPGLAGIHVLGTPSFYCVLAPGQTDTSTTFGGADSSDIVKFTLGPNAKPDASFVGLDGPPIFVPCTPVTGGQVCDSPPFAIPAYSKAIVGNLADIEACVPAIQNTDCNGVAGNPKAASAAKVRRDRDFQLFFADDRTYNAANTFGGVTLQISGTWPPCTIDVGPDKNSDVPPGYTDPVAPVGATPWLADFKGVGPNVEFDISAKSPGTCTVNLTEDTGLKRTFAFQIAVKSGW